MGMQELCADAFQEVKEVGVPGVGEWEPCGDGGQRLSTVMWERLLCDPRGNIQ